MDRRHLLEAQRSQMAAAHQGLPTTSFRTPPLPVQSPLSPIIRQHMPHASAPHLFPTRLPHLPPHMAYDNPLSSQLVERQRELKEISLMQAKLAQQRSMLAYPVATVPHVAEDRVQFVPAIPSNMSPEDSLAQLRRLHQQVLSMPSQEPHYYDVPPPSRPRESKEIQEAEFLRLSAKERLLLMEKHLQNAKRLGSREHEATSSYYASRMAQHQPQTFPVPPRSPISRPSTSRPSPSRPSVFMPSDVMNHELSRSLRESAENSRIMYEMEKAKKEQQGHYLRQEPVPIYQQKQVPCPNAVVVPHEAPSRLHSGMRSNLHPSYYPHVNSRTHSRPPSTERKRSPETPIRSMSAGYTIPQIKNVKSLASSDNVEKRFVQAAEQRELWMKMVENKIKQELDKDEEQSPHPSRSSSCDAHPSAITKVPSIHLATSGVKGESQNIFKEQSSSRSDPHYQAPQATRSMPQRKRAASFDGNPEKTLKRSRGSGDIFKARLADYALSSHTSGRNRDGAVSSSLKPTGLGTPNTGEQPLDLSVNNIDPSGSVEHSSAPPNPPKNLSKFSNPSHQASIVSYKKATTISDIISQAVLASLEKPYKRDETTPTNRKAIPLKTSHETSSSSGVQSGDDKVNKISADVLSVPEEGSRQQLIDHLSTEFAGSFKHFLASLLHECKEKGFTESLEIQRAGQAIPGMMKEELERCDIKISQTIRALLNDEKERETSHPSDESRVEKDTSPPCQVSTTTDILQHNSPPSSPSEVKLQQELGKDDAMSEVEEIPPVNLLKRIEPEVQRRTKSVECVPSSPGSKTENEGVEHAILLPQSDELQTTYKFHEEDCSDIPLCIDVGEMPPADDSMGDSEETPLPANGDNRIEEDAIDRLMFGNEEIDTDSTGMKIAHECSDQKSDVEDSGSKLGTKNSKMNLQVGLSRIKVDSKYSEHDILNRNSVVVSGDAGMVEDTKDSVVKCDEKSPVMKLNTEMDCEKELYASGVEVGTDVSDLKGGTEEKEMKLDLVGSGNESSPLLSKDIAKNKDNLRSDTQHVEKNELSERKSPFNLKTGKNTDSNKGEVASGRSNSHIFPVAGEGVDCTTKNVERDSKKAIRDQSDNIDPQVKEAIITKVSGEGTSKSVAAGFSHTAVTFSTAFPSQTSLQKQILPKSGSSSPNLPITAVVTQSPMTILPKSVASTNPSIVSVVSKSPLTIIPKSGLSSHPPVSSVATQSPLTIALPKVIQIKQVATPPQVYQIVPSQVTSNIVATLTAPIISTPGPSATNLMVQSNQPIVATLTSSRGITSSPTLASSSVRIISPPPVSSPPVSAVSNVSTAVPAKTNTPSSESSTTPLPLAPLVRKSSGGTSKWWNGNELIPYEVTQEPTKKPSVPAYTVVYLATRLPCVVRSSVPFVPPKILWKNLFPKVSFNEFNKTLSTCSILQRYMTVMEQAALQKDLISNDISSCKLVPLDEFDKNYQAVQNHLSRPSKTGKSSGDCLQS